MRGYINKILLSVALLIFAVAAAQAAQDTRARYVERYKAIALDNESKYGIPASIILAQGILESGSGESSLAKKSNNHFGIKCKSEWSGKKVYHDDDAKGECFRAYSSVELSYRDHAEFLKNSPRYASLFSLEMGDYRSWAAGLKAAGYATAPDYAQRLVKIIEDNKLYALSASTGGGVQEAAAAGVQGVAPQSGGVVRVLTIPSSRVIDQAMAEARFELYKNNGVHFVLTRRGETLADIARFFGLSTYTLRRYNNLGRGAQLREGEVIYVEQKASKWRGHHPQHIVSSGETLTEISQTYAVKLRSLKRYNKQSAHGKLRVGDRVDLCKIK